MADPYSADNTATNLAGHVSGDNTSGTAWHLKFSDNHYAWFYVIGALLLLWGMGGAFKSVLS